MSNVAIDLRDKSALVTGSSSGIGLEIARKLAQSGCHLMLHGIDSPEQMELARKEMSVAGAVSVGASHADLSDKSQAARLVADTLTDLRSIDILVNNAGIQHVAPVDEFSDEHWDKIIEVNLSASFRLIRHVLPVMRKGGWGRIINIASVHGLVASKYKGAYVAAKHGLVGLTKTVALETAEDPVTCNALCPGYVRTPLVEAQIDAKAGELGCTLEEAANALLQEKQPSLNFIETAQVASMVAYLCSDACDEVTGSAMTIDGAWSAQ